MSSKEILGLLQVVCRGQIWVTYSRIKSEHSQNFYLLFFLIALNIECQNGVAEAVL